MKEDEFKKRKINWIKNRIGSIKLDRVDELPKNLTLAREINEFLDEFERINIGEIYFVKSQIKGYYLEITTQETVISELLEKIKQKLIYY